MSRAEIEASIPHRPPFLFLDAIVSRGAERIICRKRFSGEEWFFAGHYPDYPLVPGVILCEAAMQTGAVLIGGTAANKQNTAPVVTRMNEVRFKQPIRPGDTIEIEVQLLEKLSDAFFFEAKITCAGKIAARLEFACKMVPH